MENIGGVNMKIKKFISLLVLMAIIASLAIGCKSFSKKGVIQNNYSGSLANNSGVTIPPNFVYDEKSGGYYDPDDPFYNIPSEDKMAEWETVNMLTYDEWVEKSKDNDSTLNKKVIESINLLKNVKKTDDEERSSSILTPSVIKTFDPVVNLGSDYLDEMENWLKNDENEVVSLPVRYAYMFLTKTQNSSLATCITFPTKYWVHLLDNIKTYCKEDIYKDINNINSADQKIKRRIYSNIISSGIYAENAIKDGIKSSKINKNGERFLMYINNKQEFMTDQKIDNNLSEILNP